ncbi:MAG TPA: flagellar basal body-associated FliL family protein [Bdellovibrionota bacterium]|jgi:flagellar basal body-associated protein FliL|nr:flagellar basal body-associated FliL family protein [Bdellovibrionota bacterium]
MATEEKGTTEEGAAPAPKKKLPIGLILILLQTLGTLGAAGFTIWALKHPPKPPVSKGELQERNISSVMDLEADIKNVDLQEFQVNAKTGGTLRAKIVLEVSNTQVESLVNGKLPRVKDLVGSILSDVNRKEFLDIQGKLAVKNHLRNSINEMILPMLPNGNPGIVREVYLVDLLVN